jgi:hypothetical protein
MKYNSVTKMVGKISAWKFKLMWIWHRLTKGRV